MVYQQGVTYQPNYVSVLQLTVVAPLACWVSLDLRWAPGLDRDKAPSIVAKSLTLNFTLLFLSIHHIRPLEDQAADIRSLRLTLFSSSIFFRVKSSWILIFEVFPFSFLLFWITKPFVVFFKNFTMIGGGGRGSRFELEKFCGKGCAATISDALSWISNLSFRSFNTVDVESLFFIAKL